MKILSPLIIYFPANKPYSFSHSVWPTYFRNRSIHYRYYQSRKDYKSVVIKESITFWILFALLVCIVTLLFRKGRINWMEIANSFMLTVAVVPLIYLIKAYLYHLEPKRIYRQTQQLFAHCPIDNSLMEIEPQCFIFKKDAYDFRLKYVKGLRTHYLLTVFFRHTLNISSAKLENFNQEMEGSWQIGKKYPFMASCTIPEQITPAVFETVIDKVLTELQAIGFTPSAHVESIEFPRISKQLIP